MDVFLMVTVTSSTGNYPMGAHHVTRIHHVTSQVTRVSTNQSPIPAKIPKVRKTIHFLLSKDNL